MIMMNNAIDYKLEKKEEETANLFGNMQLIFSPRHTTDVTGS
jgi:hypothetical protein